MAGDPYVWDGSDKFYHSPTSAQLLVAQQEMLHGDGPPVDGVTGLGSTRKVYQNDSPDVDAGEAVMYVNTDPASPSVAPAWHGLLNT